MKLSNTKNNYRTMESINQENLGADAMKTLTECLNKVAENGYTINFSIKNKQLFDAAADKYYEPKETHIINYYRFEGASDPDDTDILYVIETSDGKKGVLTDAYGAYANAGVNAFIIQVEDIHKKNAGQ